MPASTIGLAKGIRMINTKRELIWAVITLCLLFIIVSNMDYIDQLNTTVSKCEADSGNNDANKLKQFKEWHNYGH